ncbi:NAD(P)H-hydrate dehydratase [Amphritea balenae]|uniref:Bifunctional NAD(P)H-hydrate repair enzyme n=1 Tax=Amphritea balenae TaxID=452629 RepID=A0A3P1SRC6_9GAMM|nr:NAD(P)H-hydrate dehydratase [Amphritea balenae]RRC99751.1 NAD(P)H-hydrate dehydratase [Amphritea balenae]GGK79535.1 bifunctional NAD(P)H-hydrate repair enzyme Nnr [Amphritea balenae]
MTLSNLPTTLYTAEQTRALDSAAIAGGVPGFKLMQRAGHGAFDRLRQRWPKVKKLTILCGSGNNGGDGFVVAVLARQQGLQVQLLCLGGEDFADKLQGEALQAWQWMHDEGVAWQSYAGQGFSGELVVDAMLGTGLTGNVRGQYPSAIEQLNSSPLPVIALDIPSGLCSDTGMPLGQTVSADMTVTFIGVKRGLLTGRGPEFTGELLFDSLRVEESVYETVSMAGFITGAEDCKSLLPARSRSAHKGSCGHVLVVGGDNGMGGAAIMAAQAAGRTGAGLVTVATRAEHVPALLTRYPEAMAKAVRSGADLEPLIARADVIVIGPGLGQGAWGEQMLMQALQSAKPLVLDADALNLLSAKKLFGSRRGSGWIITPHPGEAARLLETSVTDIQRDRFDSINRLQSKFGGVALLKGPGSLSCDGDVLHLCPAGNPGMASGGMGDVLSGVIGALLAQGLSGIDATRLGAWLHASAADRSAEENGARGMQATDLLAQLRLLVNGM